MKIKLIVLLLTILFVCELAQAYGWPTLSVLKQEQIDALFTSSGCKEGMVRIPPGTKVIIKNRYIPSNKTWYWIYQGPDECVLMPNQIHYTDLQVTGNQDNGGQIFAHYKIDQFFAFSFVFSYAPGWDCGPFVGTNPPEIIGCARDT